jgi:hypothetical protein
VKATFVPTNEHRFVVLPTPASFTVLMDKLTSLFAIDSACDDLRVHYVDDESDRVAMSSSEELACALSLAPAGRQLRLYVSSTPSSASSAPSQPLCQQQEEQVKDEPAQEKECALPATPASSEASGQEMATADVIKGQLQAAGEEVEPDGSSTIDEKRRLRVLARFYGDAAKAAKAIERMHARKHLHQQLATRPDAGRVEARRAQREARKSERLAARLARQKQRNNDHATDCNTTADQQKTTKPEDKAAIDSLVAFIADQQQQQKHDEGVPIAPIGRGKCTAAWRKADGDMEAAKAVLLAWNVKSQQRQQQQRKKEVDLDMVKLMEQLKSLGFGSPTAAIAAGADDKCENKAKGTSERIHRRNERLIKRFGGELSLVVEFLEARQAKVDARKTARKASRCGRRHQKQTNEHQTNEQAATAL